MKPARLLACCLLLFPLAGSAPPPVRRSRAKPLNNYSPEPASWKALRSQLNHGIELFRSGRYNEASQLFESIHQRAFEAQVWDLAARARGNTGSCQFALHQYQPALQSFLAARHLAEKAADRNELAALNTNIGSLYAEIGDLNTAVGWTQGSLDQLTGEDRQKHVPEVLIQLATLRARQGRMPEALELFRQGIDAADRAGDWNLYAIGWNRLGEEYFKTDNLPAAESAFLEAFRVRKLNRLSLETSYRDLGRLRLRQGDLVSASHLLDRYVELAEGSRGGMPSWNIYLSRGQIRLAQGRLDEALRDLRIAVRLGRAWRWSVPASDGTRIGTEGMLDQVYSALIEAGNRLYLKTHDPQLARETFEAAEENRASSLRALAAGPGEHRDLSPAGWEALLRLQRAEVEVLRSPSAAARNAVAAARAEEARLEEPDSHSSTNPDTRDLSVRTQSALDSESALISFQLGDSISWMWVLDRQSLALYPLPPRGRMETRIASAVRAIREDLPGSTVAGSELYTMIFGRLARQFREKKRWLLALDQADHSALTYSSPIASGLFDVPFPALALPAKNKRPLFLAERHSTLVIPGAGYWLDSTIRKDALEPRPLFLGAGDPIYNSADPRLNTPSGIGPYFRPADFVESALPLPRLVASGSELDACARAWHGETVLLKGTDVSRLRIKQELERNPAVLHLATHIVPSNDGSAAGMIALSLLRSESELLTAVEIAHWRIHTGVVVMAGCHSARGSAPPGTGISGLTRAWLAAGARTVIASRWDTPDETGALFSEFYRKLRTQSRRDAAGALRAAQLEVLKAGGWRSRPSFWGAYLAVGQE